MLDRFNRPLALRQHLVQGAVLVGSALACLRRCHIPHIVDMGIHMKTTLNIDDTLMRGLRQEAARRDTTMTALVEPGLRIVLADPDAAGGKIVDLPPLPSWSSGGQLVDISDREELYSAMEDE